MKIAWVTNLSAPYRWPVWSALANHHDVRIGLLAKSEANRTWDQSLPPAVGRLSLESFQIRTRKTPIYALRSSALNSFTRGDILILPGWENPAAWQLLLESKMRGITTIAFYESSKHSQRFSRGLPECARRQFFNTADGVLTVGAASHEAVMAAGVEKSKTSMTHNTIDINVFHPPGHSVGIRQRFDILFVGQMIDRKNVQTLLEALCNLSPAVRLHLVGIGPLERELRARAASLGVGNQTVFHGQLGPEEVASIMHRCSTLVLPSTEEVYGLVVSEALAAGLHVVVSRACGIVPDIASMPGVWICDPSADGISEALTSSFAGWAGPVSAPPILTWTPEKFAMSILSLAERLLCDSTPGTNSCDAS